MSRIVQQVEATFALAININNVPTFARLYLLSSTDFSDIRVLLARTGVRFPRLRLFARANGVGPGHFRDKGKKGATRSDSPIGRS